MKKIKSWFSTSEPKYPHRDRLMAYRSEKLEINEEEVSILKEWVSLSVKHQTENDRSSFVTIGAKQKIIFDTDIGTDVDDALALLMLLNLPPSDYELLGVTTVYGRRSFVPRSLSISSMSSASENFLSLFIFFVLLDFLLLKIHSNRTEKGKWAANVTVTAGEGVPVGTHRPVWITGTEGKGLFEKELCESLTSEKGIGDEKSCDAAAKWMVSQVNKYPNEITIIALGMQSNIARACKLDPSFASRVKHLVYMAQGKRMEASQTELFSFTQPDEPYAPGKVYYFYPNHNISGDTWAAMQVFRNAFPRISVINDDVTNELWWAGEAARRLRHAASPAHHAVVGKLLNVWLNYRSGLFARSVPGTCPHDAITTAEAIYPDRFVEYVRGRLLIHEWAGFSTFVLDPTGPHRIGIRMKSQPPGKPHDDSKARHKKSEQDYRDGTGHEFIRWLSDLLAPADMQSAPPDPSASPTMFFTS